MKLCVAILEPSIERALATAERVAERGALAEIRLDAIAGCDRLEPEDLAPLAGLAARDALLLTVRRPRDGGRSDVPDERRLALLAGGSARLGARCDVEQDVAARAYELGIRPDRTVLSVHDFSGTPSDLVGMFERMAETPAWVYKIATLARTSADGFRHFEVLARARATGRSAISIAMGERGVATRVLGPALGAAFTFCSVEAGREGAPGQVALADMLDLYRADKLSMSTMLTGLVAGTIGYSRSPAMHNRAAAELGVDLVYAPFATDDLAAFVDGFRRTGLDARGFSVTNPFKTEIVPHLARLDPLAERVGAVNTVVVEEGGALAGYNTDVEGAMRPLEAAAGPLAGRAVGVIGAGGAARAVACGLAGRGARTTIFARRPEAARDVAAPFGAEAAPIDAVRGADLDVLVNATPAGTAGLADGELPVDERALAGVRFVYDLVYAPERTPLLVAAEHAGCATLGGLEMLATQAALQFELWTDRAVDPARMLAFARA